MGVPKSPQKVFALFGSDLEAKESSFFTKQVEREHYAFVALDSMAMGLLEEARVPYTLIDDWVSPEARLQAHRDALVAERSWFEPTREAFTEQGICWPEIDQYLMRGFWVQAMTALALGNALRDQGCHSLKFFGSYLPRPAIVWNPSDIAAAVWQRQSVAHVDEIRSILLSGGTPRVGEIWTKVVRRLRSRGGTKAGSPAAHHGETICGSIVLVLGYEQRHRYAHAIQQLKSHFPGRVAAVLNGPYPDLAESLGSEWSIPVAAGPPLPVATLLPQLPARLSRSCDPQLAGRFAQAYETCRHASRGQAWHLALDATAFHFRYFCHHRWPVLCRKTAPFWTDLVERERPSVLLVPAIETPEYLLPSIAATRLGIPTFVLPEAAARTGCFCGLFSEGTFLCDLPLQRTLLERSGYQSTRLLSVQSILSDQQYPSRHARAFTTENKLHVLVLTNPTGMPGLLMHMVSLKAQYHALRVLSEPPAALDPFLEMRIKVHPKYHDREMIKAVSARLATAVLPPEADLERVLASTDLVVAANYRGSALVHCLRHGTPVVQFSTEPEALLKSPLWCGDLFTDGVTVAHNAEDFWQAIERFRSDPHTRAAMQTMSQTFARNHLDAAPFLPLHEIVGNVL